MLSCAGSTCAVHSRALLAPAWWEPMVKKVEFLGALGRSSSSLQPSHGILQYKPSFVLRQKQQDKHTAMGPIFSLLQ